MCSAAKHRDVPRRFNESFGNPTYRSKVARHTIPYELVGDAACLPYPVLSHPILMIQPPQSEVADDDDDDDMMAFETATCNSDPCRWWMMDGIAYTHTHTHTYTQHSNQQTNTSLLQRERGTQYIPCMYVHVESNGPVLRQTTNHTLGLGSLGWCWSS